MVFPISYSLNDVYAIAKQFGNVKKISDLSSSSSSSSSRPGSAEQKEAGEVAYEEGEIERARNGKELSYLVEYEERYSIFLMQVSQQRANGINMPLKVESLFN